jgi:Sortase domain
VALAAPALCGVLLLAACGSPSPTAPSRSGAATGHPAPVASPSAPPSASASPAATAVEPVTGRGSEPVRMSIGAIDIDSRVQPVGAPDRVLEIPPKPWVVGWWKGGVGPGSGQGTVVLVAHLDSRTYGTGPFARARDLSVGDPMTLTDNDALVHDYRVASVETYLKKALPYEQIFTQSGPERVVIVTCGGEYHRDSGGWDSNVVVTFTPA